MKMIHFLFCLIFLISSITFAEESLSTSDPTPTEKRSIVVMPMLNVVVPGLTQFIDGEPKKTSVFLSAALSSIVLYRVTQESIHHFKQSDSERYHSYRDNQRANEIAMSLGKHASFISLYDGFLTLVEYYQTEGKYLFLPQDQNLEFIHKAPFNFSYLKNATTWAPLLLAVGLGV